jgi:uncharacterized protein YhfF
MEVAIPHRAFWRRFRADTGIADADARFAGTLEVPETMGGLDGDLELVLSGDKTASSALLADYREAGIALPKVFGLTILVDPAGNPCGVIETLELTVERFSEIDDSFARAHGAGQSLKSWRRQCRSAFAARARALGAPFGEDTEMVCHRYRLVYTPRGDAGAHGHADAVAAGDCGSEF